MAIRHLGVFLSADELQFIAHLLINLKADDLIQEDARREALAWITRLQQDLSRIETGPASSLRSRRCHDASQ